MDEIKLNTIDDFARLAADQAAEVEKLIALPEFYRSPGQNYYEQQQHAGHVDSILGFDVAETEKVIDPKNYPKLEPWVGLRPEQLQTPYDELLLITQLLQLRENEHVVDLGAGYGRLGMVLSQQAPDVQFTGYELVSKRVDQGSEVLERFTGENIQLLEQNLLEDEFQMINADVYFVYDFGQKEHLQHTLSRLEEKSLDHPFRLVARGRGVRSLIHHGFPRLCHAIDPIHFESFSVYSTP